jgi:hypothetical protein
MKKTILLILLFSFWIHLLCEAQKSESSLNISTDLVSNYIWRGSKLSNGPCIQPTLEFSTGGLSMMVWGSYGISDPEALETDLYAKYSFNCGLTVGVNDYYMPSTRFFCGKNHAFEPYFRFQTGNFSFTANYIVNKGSGMEGGDTYLEIGYNTGGINLFAGAGNAWYTAEGRFAICNVGISTSKEIRITDSFSFPLTGSVILNPDTEKLFIVVGITL